MKLVCLVIVILYFKGSMSTISVYNDDSHHFLCGCASETQYNKSIQIKCKDDEVIQMEPSGYLMRDSTKRNISCDYFDFDTCSKSYTLDVLNLADRIEVYKQCSNQNSCDIKIAGKQEDKDKLVIYPFFCHPVSESPIEDLSKKFFKPLTNPIFYFTGEKYAGQRIDCTCSLTSSDLELDILFINLKPHKTSKVKFFTQHFLFESPITGMKMLRTYFGYIGTYFKLEIRGLEPDVEDVIYFRVWGSKLTINCDGCTNSTDATATVSTDQTNNDVIYTLGGILAAVIIIVIVGISLYCFIRHRKNQQKTRDAPTNTGNDGQSQYSYIDIIPDSQGSNYRSLTRSNGVQNDQRF